MLGSLGSCQQPIKARIFVEHGGSSNLSAGQHSHSRLANTVVVALFDLIAEANSLVLHCCLGMVLWLRFLSDSHCNIWALQSNWASYAEPQGVKTYTQYQAHQDHFWVLFSPWAVSQTSSLLAPSPPRGGPCQTCAPGTFI